ncbi:MAG: pyruvate dehydrogenase (acetyl-transferring), homodimeric type [Candidatus Poseidoniia archaeon]|jgi:pyruvate dehydrogenase E1 component|nr:pyruvate dehydrogenase (acetyl-transferring), homodimeric type [Candidatus Poseidoniia archaeon]|tara:strand:- start:14398 stop:17055 length:2658 start_codon:yes stop_codon:yes gene_type:complete
MQDNFTQQLPDRDPQETREWIESLEAVIEAGGSDRARNLLYRLLEAAQRQGVAIPEVLNTPYINTIPASAEPPYPGDEGIERRIRRIIRWNAAMMVSRANKRHGGIGGHISTYASAASLYEIGFHHFFRGKERGPGDLVYFQGHASPGIYSRAFLEGRLSEAQMDHFRREAFTAGLSSYPHPRLMPDFWEFPTVSMGLGPTNAIYQARFNRYLHARGIADTSQSRVWAFPGDGECDEPETLHALTLAAREKLDNLTFVVNCNLQRLDGPVRGNGKIVQELEAKFLGAGWNVIKVIWGSDWDPLLARDSDGLLLHRMEETLDGDYQRLAVESADNIREQFFGPELQHLVAGIPDDELTRMRRGGHDTQKVYTAYAAAMAYKGAPTAILAKTVKGWALGGGFEARNITHQKKALESPDLKFFRDLLELQISDDELEEFPYYLPADDSEEVQYLLSHRDALGGCVPQRNRSATTVALPKRDTYREFDDGSGEQQVSTTMAFVRLMRNLMLSGEFGKRIVPIVPDEARTFGIEALFTEFKIYNALGQDYTPVDAELLLSYVEAEDGQILEEGISEAGAMSSFTAAGTAHSSFGEQTIPFYIFYSMFGFQRVGDAIWCAADSRARGFLLGATAGRTTLNGEGLQHQDGHSLLVAATVPCCLAYDPAFAYEIAVIVREGLRRMVDEQEDLLYYLTLYNENYAMPPKPARAERGIIQGIYRFRKPAKPQVRLFGSGSIMQQVLRAAQILEEKFGVAAEIWSVTSYGGLRRDALKCERWNWLHPTEEERTPFIQQQLGKRRMPTIAATDFMRAVPDMVGKWVPGPYITLGTDGFGRSDTREQLRSFFEVSGEHITVAALNALAQSGKFPAEDVASAIRTLGVDPELADPFYSY